MRKITLDTFHKLLDDYKLNDSDYIVRLMYKYDWEENYSYENVIYSHTGEYTPDGSRIWEVSNDWNEGQKDCWVIGYIALQDIQLAHMEMWSD